MDVRPQLTYKFPVMEIGKLDGDAKKQLHVACLNGDATKGAHLMLHACGMQNTTAWRCWFFCILAMEVILLTSLRTNKSMLLNAYW